MIIIKCCANCDYCYEDEVCTRDYHITTADDWCPRWGDEDEPLRDAVQRQ